ncbi:MAG: DUF3291 domain-containing protein [Chloroflexi bacterium]|nr:DUF3291 domain-containing protein [Chloroflexota bacterium]
MTQQHHLAQVNIGRVRAPISDPVMVEFVAGLEELNRLADKSPGFVWRMQTEEGDNTAVRAFDDDTILINMSVWESVESLSDYVYRSSHKQIFARRREWFHVMETPTSGLWWVPAGHMPTTDEAKERLEKLQTSGPNPSAFTFLKPFPSPNGEAIPQ